jgi:hypothetical protein
MKEPTTIYAASFVSKVALSLWGVGYDMFVVSPSGVLVEWSRKGLMADVYCALDESKKDANEAWRTATSVTGSKTFTPALVEALILAVNEIRAKKEMKPREGFPPLPCACGRVGEPTLAVVVLADQIDRIGAWCRGCRKWIQIIEGDLSLIPEPERVLGRRLPVDRLIPEPGEKWPVLKEDVSTAFPFGALGPRHG